MASINDEYEKLQRLGSGSFATIWKVRHKTLGYVRALKVSKEEVTSETEHAYQQFLKECTVLLKIGNGCHPNIVRIYQPRLLDGRASVEMDYVKGQTLTDYLRKVKFIEMDEFYRLFEQIVGALAYCHHDIYQFLMDPNTDDIKNDPDDGQRYLIDEETERRLVAKYAVIHNDIHSNNVMRRDYDGCFVLLDFGLAIEDGQAVRTSARTGGALEYMAPEKFERSSNISTQSDIYSLGILLYEALAGRVPFVLAQGASILDQTSMYQQHKTGIPPSIEALRREAFEAANPGQNYQKDYPDWLEQMIMRCLEKDPARRYTDAKELMNDFKAMYQPQMAAVASNVKVVEKIVEKRVEVPVEKVVDVPSMGISTPMLKLRTDMDCVLYIDGDKRANLKVGELTKVPLAKGEYELKFVTIDEKDCIEDTYFAMPDNDKQYTVALKKLREQREYKEREERQKLEREEQQRNGLFAINGVSFKMVKVEGGTFWMGANNGYRGLFRSRDTSMQNYDKDAGDNEKPVHQVTLSDYYIGETEVTQELWEAVMGSNPSLFKGSTNPVEQVSWDDCKEFISRLNRLTGQNFRMPTEAEWEYAARGGRKSQGYKCSGSNIPGDVAWYDGNSGSKTHPVKTKNANELGLYDMSGNVWEWCQDWYGSYSGSSQTNPKGPSAGSYRVGRGGSWGYDARGCRVSNRGNDPPGVRNRNIGFRLAMGVDKDTIHSSKVQKGFVDLGLPSGTLWKNLNETNPNDDHDFYTYDEAVKKYGDQLPTKAQLRELKDKCTWTWDTRKKGYNLVGPNGNSIFLPAAGYRGCDGSVSGVGSNGDCWSSTPDGSDYAWCLSFDSREVYTSNGGRCYGRSVRLVQD